MLGWIIGGIIFIIAVMVFIKIATKKNNGTGSSLDEIKRRFDDACKKIGLKVGC